MDYSKVVSAFYVGIRAGLIDEKHYRKMGSAIWLFMWCVHRQTGVHEGRGVVMWGQAITYEMIHAETGYAVGTIRDWMRALKQQSYVATKSCGNGLQIWVLGQKKTKVRVLKLQQSGVLKVQQSRGKSQHSSSVPQTKDKDLNFPPNCPNTLQDNTTAASSKPLAVSLIDLGREKQLPKQNLGQKDAEQRRQFLLRQGEEMQRKFSSVRPA